MTSLATIVEGKTAEPKPVHPIIELFTGEQAQRYLSKFLPEGHDLLRVATTVMAAVQNDKTRTLAKCTKESLILGVLKILQWGLELGTTAYLLPFKDRDQNIFEATPVADYKGLAELMIGSGAVRFIETKPVYEGDHFDYEFGTGAFMTLRPCAKSARGKILYGTIKMTLPGGVVVFDVMDAEDIDALRQKFSKQWKNGPLPAWYVNKTMVRQSTKLVPKNPRFASAFAKVLAVLDDDKSIELEPTATITAVKALRENVHEEQDDDERVSAFNDSHVDARHPADRDDEDMPF